MLKATWDTNTPTMATYFQYWWVHLPKSLFRFWLFAYGGYALCFILLNYEERSFYCDCCLRRKYSAFSLMTLINTCQIFSAEISKCVSLRAFFVFANMTSAFFSRLICLLSWFVYWCVALVDSVMNEANQIRYFSPIGVSIKTVLLTDLYFGTLPSIFLK